LAVLNPNGSGTGNSCGRFGTKRLSCYTEEYGRQLV
jgi:hypothetical protein